MATINHFLLPPFKEKNPPEIGTHLLLCQEDCLRWEAPDL